MSAATKTPKAPGAEAICQGVGLVVGAGAVHEVRILNTRCGTVSGYFDSPDALTEAVVQWDGKAAAIYVTLNPVKPDLLARAVNRLRERVRETTTDQDILRRRMFGLDFDPARPTGISSTDAEHEAALSRARQVRDFLSGGGWPDPALIDSGNGGHLVYEIDLPNTPDSSRLIERCLAALAFQFTDDVVTLDLKVGNAARIWKVPGTMACKGDHTETRPHRRSRILEAPASLTLVPLDLLEGLAATAPKAEDNGHRPSGAGQAFDLDAWMASHPLPIVSSGPWNNGRKWILNPCPWNPEHTNRAAYIVQFASGAIAAGCHHNGCHGRGWGDLRDLVEPGWRAAREGIPARETAWHRQEQETAAEAPRLTLVELRESYLAFCRDPRPRTHFGFQGLDKYLRGIAPGEVAQVLARSGVGKTQFLLNALLRNADHNALLFSLEMPGVQIFERLAAMILLQPASQIESLAAHDSTGLPEALHAVERRLPRLTLVDAPQTMEGLDRTLSEYRAALPSGERTGLVLLDYLGLIIPPRGTLSIYERVSEAARGLKMLARTHDLPILSACQISREGEDGSVPVTLNMARDSGAIEEAADYVLGMWRPGVREPAKGPADPAEADKVLVRVLKNRSGPAHKTTALRLDPHTLELTDW